MSHAQLTHSGHISALGQRLGPTKAIYIAFGPLMAAAFLVVGVAMFAPPAIRPDLAVWPTAAAILAFAVFPLWYFRGRARWAWFSGVLLILVISVAAYEGLLHLILAVFG